MKRVLFMAVLILLTSSLSVMAVELDNVNGSKPDIPGFVGYAPNRIVVIFDSSTLSGLDRAAMARGITGIPALDRVGSRYGVTSLRPQFPDAKGKAIGLAGWHKVKFSRNVDVVAAVEEYKSTPGVVDAQPVGIHRVSQTPNDGWYLTAGYQWHLEKIQAPQAWDIEIGDPAIVVAVLDTGVRYFHKDLGGSGASLSDPTNVSGNMWLNPAAGGSGYVDDWIGWDFVDDPCGEPYMGLCIPCCCYEGVDDSGGAIREDCLVPDNDPRDFHGHGTHCAGNVSAINNNKYATASPAGGWGSGSLVPGGNGVKVMGLRVGWDAFYVFPGMEVGLVAMDYAAEALVYAADHGAKIASCSWGSDNSGGIDTAIAYFVERGGLIFKAAGNESSETADFICSRDDVICVAATDQNDCKANFSNYGTWVDVSAPGVQVGSLYHWKGDPANDYVAPFDGTSMATPLAASVAALIWSQNPVLPADEVKGKLFASADDSIYNLSCNSTYAGKLGAGRINAYRAVSAGAPAPALAADFDASPRSGDAPLTVAFTDRSTCSAAPCSSWSWSFGDGATSNDQNPSHPYAEPGSYAVSLTVRDSQGREDTETRADYIAVTDGSLSTVGVTSMETGKYGTFGRGKDKYTEYTQSSTFVQGDEVIIRAWVVADSIEPVSGATVKIRLSLDGWFTDITSGPSDSIDGMAEARWKTASAKGRSQPTEAGVYTATVIGVTTGDGLQWNGSGTSITFTIKDKI